MGSVTHVDEGLTERLGMHLARSRTCWRVEAWADVHHMHDDGGGRIPALDLDLVVGLGRVACMGQEHHLDDAIMPTVWATGTARQVA